ncbi:MAG TPA: alpha/beta hydrolase-fold protein [Steroidobacteraceae bacterium]|nr:alpha/beta hydrolase-fold protein [Steroidobacteraceae bacterium]
MKLRTFAFALIACTALGTAASAAAPGIAVNIRVDPKAHPEPVTGRVFLMISRNHDKEPRLMTSYTYAYYFNDPAVTYAPLYGKDVTDLKAGEPVVIDAKTVGYPFKSLKDFPPGDYSVQAVLNVYTKFARADGHVIYAHADRGEGQQFHLSPGNLVSEPQRVTLDPKHGIHLDLKLTRTLPAIPTPADTKYVKRVSFTSKLISKFWGQDMRFGAIVVLPKGYDEHPDVHYPVVFHQGHWMEGEPFGFVEELPPAPAADASPRAQKHYAQVKALHDAWLSDSMPRFILVSLQHPTPYYDDSYLANSANNGPWEDALMQEMLPFLEAKFRIIPNGYARVMFGGSTGGWISAALQIHRPNDFGGAWVFCPDPVDFREFVNVDLYADSEAFTAPGYEWTAPERFMSRSVKGQPRVSVRDFSRVSAVLGSHGRSGEFFDMWSAVYGPVGSDGYPKLVWDYATGKIDHSVVEYWRSHGFDLREYAERNWKTIGKSLAGKLHFSTGDMDNFYLNLAMYRMQDFLVSADPPYGGSIKFGRPMIGHEFYGYDPWPMAMLDDMAAQIEHNTPPSALPVAWRYK